MTSQKLEECQKTADEVTGLMKDNVEKIFEREGKLENLADRSEELKNMAVTFQKTAQAVERKTRWEKWRWYIISAVIIILLLVIIIAIILSQTGGDGPSPSAQEGN